MTLVGRNYTDFILEKSSAKTKGSRLGELIARYSKFGIQIKTVRQPCGSTGGADRFSVLVISHFTVPPAVIEDIQFGLQLWGNSRSNISSRGVRVSLWEPETLWKPKTKDIHYPPSPSVNVSTPKGGVGEAGASGQPLADELLHLGRAPLPDSSTGPRTGLVRRSQETVSAAVSSGGAYDYAAKPLVRSTLHEQGRIVLGYLGLEVNVDPARAFEIETSSKIRGSVGEFSKRYNLEVALEQHHKNQLTVVAAGPLSSLSNDVVRGLLYRAEDWAGEFSRRHKVDLKILWRREERTSSRFESDIQSLETLKMAHASKATLESAEEANLARAIRESAALAEEKSRKSMEQEPKQEDKDYLESQPVVGSLGSPRSSTGLVAPGKRAEDHGSGHLTETGRHTSSVFQGVGAGGLVPSGALSQPSRTMVEPCGGGQSRVILGHLSSTLGVDPTESFQLEMASKRSASVGATCVRYGLLLTLEYRRVGSIAIVATGPTENMSITAKLRSVQYSIEDWAVSFSRQNHVDVKKLWEHTEVAPYNPVPLEASGGMGASISTDDADLARALEESAKLAEEVQAKEAAELERFAKLGGNFEKEGRDKGNASAAFHGPGSSSSPRSTEPLVPEPGVTSRGAELTAPPESLTLDIWEGPGSPGAVDRVWPLPESNTVLLVRGKSFLGSLHLVGEERMWRNAPPWLRRPVWRSSRPIPEPGVYDLVGVLP